MAKATHRPDGCFYSKLPLAQTSDDLSAVTCKRCLETAPKPEPVDSSTPSNPLHDPNVIYADTDGLVVKRDAYVGGRVEAFPRKDRAAIDFNGRLPHANPVTVRQHIENLATIRGVSIPRFGGNARDRRRSGRRWLAANA